MGKYPNQKERKLIGMKSAILFSLATLTWASPAPQYSGQTQDLSEGQLDTIKDIFGTDAGDAYSGDQQTRQLLMLTTSLRTALTTQLPKATNVCLTTSATTAPSSPTEVASSTSGMALAS